MLPHFLVHNNIMVIIERHSEQASVVKAHTSGPSGCVDHAVDCTFHRQTAVISRLLPLWETITNRRIVSS
jgi:hypothetical protein